VSELRWSRDLTTPAIVWRSDYGLYEIVWDPAGKVEGEPGGWWLWRAQDQLGIFSTQREAKLAAGIDAAKSAAASPEPGKPT
jgi:hypothetical protein